MNIFYDEATMRKKLEQGFTVVKHIDWAKDYEDYSKLSTVGKRRLLRKLAQQRTVKQMTYEQAKLYHRLKGRT